MKYVFIAMLACIATAKAQERLYLVTQSGGTLNGGTILSFDPNGNNVKVDLIFGKRVRIPRHQNRMGTDGYLYCTAYQGGADAGGIFKIRPDGSRMEQIFSFSSSIAGEGKDGISAGSMVISDDGVIYASTLKGGPSGSGVIFRINQDGSGFQRLHEFMYGSLSSVDGLQTILIGMDGALYGTTPTGPSGDGAIYAVNPDGSGFRLVFDFHSGGLLLPNSLIQGQDGKLYGLSFQSLFRVNTDGTGFEILVHNFGNANPAYGIHQASNGRIYGTLDGDYSGVYSIMADGSDYQLIHLFNANEGLSPSGGIKEAPDGFLYGSTTREGLYEAGSVYRIKPDGSSFEVVSHSTIGGKSSELFIDNGILYGFTSEGGQSNTGTMFKVSSGMEEILFDFGEPDLTAYSAYEGVTQIDNSLVTTAIPMDLTNRTTTLVSLVSDGTAVTRDLPNEPKTNGASRPIKGNDGFLYSINNFGQFSNGRIFKCKPDGSSYSVVKEFYPSDGIYPDGELLLGLDGRLYGTCSRGGTWDEGVVYAVNRDGTGYRVLHHFNHPDGTSPFSGLIQGSDGTIYGSATNIFSIRPDGTNYRVLKAFVGRDTPASELTIVGSYLYGVIYGYDDQGSIFQIKIDGSGYTVIYSFNGIDGDGPITTLLPYAGSLYGTTNAGGAFGFGTIYKFSPSGTDFIKVMDLTHLTGGTPSGDLFGVCAPASKPNVTLNSTTLTSSATLGNQWFKNGVLIPGANDNSYEAVSSGEYTVAANLFDCLGEMSDAMSVIVTGIEEERDRLIEFYPNPTEDVVLIRPSNRNLVIRDISMHDMMGKEIVSHSGRIGPEWHYDLSKHGRGIYMVSVRVNGAVVRKKIVKR